MKSQNFQIILILIIVALAFSACGPSEEELAATSAAETAAAATSTPTITPTPTSTPTLTPTPIPYDLSILIIDENDIPIAGASVTLSEVEQTTNDSGQTNWTDLPEENVDLSISAQGYFIKEASETIERGPNQISMVLERDPFGLLPTQACSPDEKILYIEDLQDGRAQGWKEIEAGARGLSIGFHPDEPANSLIVASDPFGARSDFNEILVNNVVWRIRFLIDGSAQVSFNWKFAQAPYDIEEGTVNDSRYTVNMEETSYILRTQNPIRDLWAAGNPYKPLSEVWYSIEISSYEGRLEVWIDGIRILAYNDPDPLPEGGIFMEALPFVDNTIVYFDDISLCALSAPFVPMPKPESK